MKKDQLALRIRLGDKEAFELFFRKFYSRLCYFANKFLNNPEEAQEVVQDVFIRIWEERADINSDNYLKSYTFEIAQSLSINLLRNKKADSKYIEIYKLVYADNQAPLARDSFMAMEPEGQVIHPADNLPGEYKKFSRLTDFCPAWNLTVVRRILFMD
jgi:RNA polymerase sigma-70 factor (ECF subfamily)